MSDNVEKRFEPDIYIHIYLCLPIASHNKQRSSTKQQQQRIVLCAEDVVFYVNCYMLQISTSEFKVLSTAVLKTKDSPPPRQTGI